MTARTAGEEQDAAHRRSLWSALVAGLLAVGVPALLYLWRRGRAPALPSAPWGRERSTVWRHQRVVFESLGGGDPVVLLHSLGPGHHGEEWAAVAAHLGARHRVFVPDLPGFGRSAAVMGELDARTLVDFVLDFLADVVASPAVLVGCGRTAAYAVQAAAEAPHLVRALGLVAPRGLSRRQGPLRVGDRSLGWLLGLPGIASLGLWWWTTRRGISRHLETEVFIARERVDARAREQYHAAANQPGAHRALAALLSGRLEWDVRAAVEAVEIPAWVAWGRRSPAPPVEDAHLWLARLPRAELQIFEGTGLLPQAESPAAFARELESFLDRIET